MDPKDLLLLANTYAAHVQRGLFTVATRTGQHTKFFTRIAEGRGCHISAYPRVLSWFDLNWPADLEWPAEVDRPSRRRPRKPRAA